MARLDLSPVIRFGAPLAQARAAIILLHGRGSSAEDIAGLAGNLAAEGCAFLAPSAAQGAWYPRRFLEPTEQNEPWLSSSLAVIDRLAAEVAAGGLSSQRMGLIGFSQGGCLALEYAARWPRRYAFVAGLSSALIGPLETIRAPGDLQQTPMLLGCAEGDAHIPLEFVDQSAATLKKLGAAVSRQIYAGTAHTVFPQEIAWLNDVIDALR